MAHEEKETVKFGKPDRLFNLTCALLYTKRGLTKNEILRSVPGYFLEYKEGGDNSTLERKFERDKEDLRKLGIQLEAVIPAHEDENNQATVYLIKRDSFYWPSGIVFTPRQLALLNLAAEAWAGGSLSSTANRGITKLRALGVVGEDSDIVGIAPRIQAHDPSFRELSDAISDRQVVQFDYRNPQTGEVMKRTLQPWLLRQVAGSWLVLGFDELRDETRNFMLRRITGKVTPLKDGRDVLIFEAPTKEQVEEALATLSEFSRANVAKLRIQRDSEAWFRYELDLIGDGGSDILELNYHDIYLLAEQLREYASQVEVISPRELAEEIRAGFVRVVSLHE